MKPTPSGGFFLLDVFVLLSSNNLFMKLGFKYFLFLFLFIQNFSFSQDEEARLRKAINTPKDSTLIRAYLNLGKHYYFSTGKGDSLILYGMKALNLSKSLGFKAQNLESIKYVGTGYLNNSNYEKAEKHFKKGLKLAESLKDLKAIADFYNRLGAIYQNKGEYTTAIEYMLKSATYSQQTKDYKNEAYSYYGISVIYAEQKQYKKQLKYIQESIKIIENKGIGDPYMEAIIYTSASQTYLDLYNKNLNINYENKLLKYSKIASEISNKNNFASRKLAIYSILALYHDFKKEFDKAEFYAKKIITSESKITEASFINAYTILVKSNIQKNNKSLAFKYLDSLNNSKLKTKASYGTSISNLSYETYKHFKFNDLALKSLEENIKFLNELNNAEKIKAINELETKYQTDLKNSEIKNLSQQQRISTLEIENKQAQIKRLIFLLILASLIIIGILFIATKIQLKRTKQKNEALKMAFDKQVALEKELTGVRDNIAQDFHDDLGNRLARISLLSNLVNKEVSEKDDKIKSKVKQITNDSNELYAGTRDFIFSLKSNSDSLMELATYLSDFGEDYFSKTKIKFVLENQIEQDKKLPYYWVKQLIYIFKEAMTNALKYSECDTLILKFEFVNNELRIACKDNGIGMEETDLQSNNGLLNMKKRALKIGGALSIETNKGKETSIKFIGTTT